MTIPDGYALTSIRDALVIARADALDFVVAAIMEAGSLYASAATRPGARPFEGRGTTWCIDAPGGAWVVRHGRRGGAMGWLGDRYTRLGRTRPFAELHVSAHARARGLATPRVAAAIAYRHGPYYRADVATEVVADAIDLAAVLFGPGRRTGTERRGAWQAAGRLVRETANAGIFHADLNLKNVLIAGQPAAPRAWLVDLDRGRVRRRPHGRDLYRMAERLRRSLRKLERLNGQHADDAELAVFEHALGDRATSPRVSTS